MPNPRITDISGEANRAGTTYTVRRGRMASRSEVIVAERPTIGVAPEILALGPTCTGSVVDAYDREDG